MEVLFILAVLIFPWMAGSESSSCAWETSTQGNKYAFDLSKPVKGSPHGVRSEDGFYKVIEKDAEGDDEAILWFQPCEHMKFNFDPPVCYDCETCGGPDHCGETCSALRSTLHPGYAVCTTLGFSSSTSFSLIDDRKPQDGIILLMVASSAGNNCSLTVRILCNANGEQLPKAVRKLSSGGCDFETSFEHPAGCPVVSSIGSQGLGWFSTLLLVLLCLFIIYMLVATVYRRLALGIQGWEAIPHADFWQSIPPRIQLGIEFLIGKATGLYRRLTEPSYMRVNE